ncbi:VOC family protein [Methylocapsa aurea]|uniref:VOC family protein n=1 Tax=Methylocapsa aurea TaxID=663610 RepID=UPI003D18A749
MVDASADASAMKGELSIMPKNMTPFLMFEGSAQEAINFYLASIPDSSITTMDRYDGSGPEPAGSVKRALVSICGQELIFFDSPIPHPFSFTPSISFFITCADEEELDGIAGRLSAGGEYLMPPADYGFSRKFGWLKDKFGISWQLNVE